jgi:hypothetical protein
MTDETDDDRGKKLRWRETWRARRQEEDHFAENIRAAMEADEKPREPPPRRPPTRIGTWLKRPKIWEDVFTRTVANVLSVSILAALAALAGVITLDRRAWAAVSLLGGAVIGLIVVNVYPVRYLKHQWIRWAILFTIFTLGSGISLRIAGPLPQTGGPPSVCIFDAC